MISAPVLVPASVLELGETCRRAGELLLAAYRRTYRYAREQLYESLEALNSRSPREVVASTLEARTLPAEIIEPLPLSELLSLTIHSPHSPPTHSENLNRVELGLIS